MLNSNFKVVNDIIMIYNIMLHQTYMKLHVPSMLAKVVETINKQTQQTNSHNDFHKGLRKY